MIEKMKKWQRNKSNYNLLKKKKVTAVAAAWPLINEKSNSLRNAKYVI